MLDNLISGIELGFFPFFLFFPIWVVLIVIINVFIYYILKPKQAGRESFYTNKFIVRFNLGLIIIIYLGWVIYFGVFNSHIDLFGLGHGR